MRTAIQRTVVAVALILMSAACTTQKSPTEPGLTVPNLTGTWSGDLPVQGTPARMSWSLTQTNNVVTGPVLVLLPTGIVLMNGTLNGTLTGSTLTYTIAILPGGIPSLPACSGQLAGTTNATIGAPSTLSGSYAIVSSTCTTPFSGANFTLTRT